MNNPKEFADEITRGIRLQSPLILDNLGITVNVSELKTYPIKRFFQDEVEGIGFLSKIWCGFIRPLLFPKRQKNLSKLYKLSTSLFQQEHLNELIHNAEDYINE